MPLSLGDKLGLYEILSPIGTGGIQPLTRTTGVIVGSAHLRRLAIPSLSFSNCWVTVSRPGLLATFPEYR